MPDLSSEERSGHPPGFGIPAGRTILEAMEVTEVIEREVAGGSSEADSQKMQPELWISKEANERGKN